jgi:dipeptidyl aminopeptidase/acylaminoacyl peptidase
MTDDLPVEAYYDQRLAGQPAVAPGGDRVAFTAEEFDGDEDESVGSLFVVPSDGSEPPHRLTRASDASSPKWSPDGRKLAFLAVRETDAAVRAAREKPVDEDETGDGEAEGEQEAVDEDADEAADDDEDDDGEDGEEEQQVWVFDLARGGDARQVTTREHGVAEFDWGPDGERLVVSARDPTEDEEEYIEQREDDGPVEVERLQHKVNGRGWLDDVDTHLFVVDVAEREERRLDGPVAAGCSAELGGGGLQPRWGPDGTLAYVSAQDRDEPDDTYAADLWTVEPDADDPEPSKVTDGSLQVSSPSWSPDGSRLGFVGADPENWHEPSDVYVADVGDGAGEREEEGGVRSLTDALDRTAMGARWLDDDRLVAAVANEGRTELYAVDAASGERERRFAEQDDATEIAAYGTFDADPESATVAPLVMTPNCREVYALDGDTDDATQLTSFSETLAPESTVECERVHYDVDDVTVEALVFSDADLDLADGDHPVVLDIHGGPMAYDAPTYSFLTHYWTSRGYVVCRVNYRGSTSYGFAFSDSIRGDWGDRETADLVGGVEALADRGWVDPERVFVTGFSQGGVNTAYVLTRSDVATAGAAQHGIYDYRAAFGTDDSHVWWENDFGLPWEHPEAYEASSSITDVDAIDAPLLVTAGGEDWRCPPGQAEQLYVSVKKQGLPAKLVVYPDLPHDFGGPEEAVHRIETVTEWFETHDPGRADDE